jgi:uncharacterized membrane protein YciS (DUF1049 family)
MKGQISLASVFGWGLAISVAAFGSLALNVRITDSRLEETRKENVQVIQRVAKIEEAVETIKEDQKEIKKDLREILRLVK